MRTGRYALVALAGVMIAALAFTGAQTQEAAPPAQPGGLGEGTWNALSGTLLQLLAVVIVMESALAALFNWRVFRVAFNARALKTPIMFGVGLMLVLVTTYDPMRVIIAASGISLAETQPLRLFFQGLLTTILSAMIIAGGSEGIFQLLKKLGIRSPETSQDEAAANALKSDQAWVSIRATGATEPQPIQIGIEELGSTYSAANDSLSYFFDHIDQPPLAGSIDSRTVWQRAKATFTADAYRFPSYGGRTVSADKPYRITATWISEDKPKSVGIFRGKFAPRALIDLSVDLSDDPAS
ncbi:hypothetical protein ACFFJ7_17355 [Pseudochelatococcus lubricantis]|uniref:hypothetical protein n=1 Tax=Pseudochelatococcus lubricantis TaxID=1538102 RepID=UPI0035EA56DF